MVLINSDITIACIHDAICKISHMLAQRPLFSFFSKMQQNTERLNIPAFFLYTRGM